MRLLIALSVIEALLVVVVLAWALVRVSRHLRGISTNLGKITFGVRAIEQQASAIGPGVELVNTNLDRFARALVTATKRAEERGS